jgi:hypothetical protein
MPIRVQPTFVLRLSLALFLGILALACLVFYMTLINSYWNYYDMGISENANMFGVLFVHTPILLMILYASLAVCWTTMNNLQRPVWHMFLLVIMVYVLVIFAAFFVEIARTADDHASSSRTLSMFFQAYFDQWLIFLQEKF